MHAMHVYMCVCVCARGYVHVGRCCAKCVGKAMAC
jgi:hypothetical protein